MIFPKLERDERRSLGIRIIHVLCRIVFVLYHFVFVSKFIPLNPTCQAFILTNDLYMYYVHIFVIAYFTKLIYSLLQNYVSSKKKNLHSAMYIKYIYIYMQNRYRKIIAIL